jgi:hypothetical protein
MYSRGNKIQFGWRRVAGFCTKVFFFANATTCPLWTSWFPPPGFGRSVADVGGWDAHVAQLRCSDDVDCDM